MTESSIIASTPTPRTRESLAQDFRSLGIQSGMVLIVHSSMASLGWVNGGPVTVIQALQDVLTPAGTLVMPAHSGDYSDPAKWAAPPVPEDWWQLIRESMPAFDPRYTPTQGIGQVAEIFRTFPGVRRSYHPSLSFSAWGKQAGQITEQHSLAFSMGEDSPLARIYDLDGWVLLLGVGYDRNTSIHLAEYRAVRRKETMEGAPVFENGSRIWKEYQDIELDAERFPSIGADFEWQNHLIFGDVGNAQARLMRQRELVDFAVNWFNSNSEI